MAQHQHQHQQHSNGEFWGAAVNMGDVLNVKVLVSNEEELTRLRYQKDLGEGAYQTIWQHSAYISGSGNDIHATVQYDLGDVEEFLAKNKSVYAHSIIEYKIGTNADGVPVGNTLVFSHRK